MRLVRLPSRLPEQMGRVVTSKAPASALTSENNPIRVAWIDPAAIPAPAAWTGRLGMTFLPGKHDRGVAGHHWRDLRLDVARLRNEHRVAVLVLLVEEHELEATSTTAIAATMARHGIQLVRYPIVDGGVPADRAAFRSLVNDTVLRLQSGQNVVVACRGGLGRTGTLVACLIVTTGLDPETGIDMTRATRGGTIENASQEAFVRAWT